MIRALHRDGNDFRRASFLEGMHGLQKAARQHFGGWPAAVAAAGLALDRRRRWTPEATLEEIRRRFRAGQDLRGTAVPRTLFNAVWRNFGRWRVALRAAGVPPPPRRIKPPFWTRERVIRALRTERKSATSELDLRATRVRKRTSGLVHAAGKLFGGWKKALAAAGVPIPPAAHKWTSPERVLEAIRRTFKGRKVTAVQKSVKPILGMWKAVKKYFGGWRPALQAAGIPVDPRPRYTPEAIKRILREEWARRRDIRIVAVQERSPGIYPPVVRHFGSWGNALRAVGLPIPRRGPKTRHR